MCSVHARKHIQLYLIIHFDDVKKEPAISNADKAKKIVLKRKMSLRLINDSGLFLCAIFIINIPNGNGLANVINSTEIVQTE